MNNRIPLWKFWLGAAYLPVFLIVLNACAVNPVKEAETFEQKAYALYGVYVIAQGKAAELVQDAAIPEVAKVVLREADRVSYPVAETLVDAAQEVGTIKDILGQCPNLPEPDPQCVPTNEQRLANALANLNTIYISAAPVLLRLVVAVKGAK